MKNLISSTTAKDTLRHYLNAVHVMCRLRDLGLSKGQAMWVCRQWEHFIHPVIYSDGKGL